MNIIEIFANRRSGHHLFISWLASNLTDIKENKIKDLNKITWVGEKYCHYNDSTYHAFFDFNNVKNEINEIIQKKPNFISLNYEDEKIVNRVNGDNGIINNFNTTKVVFVRDFLNTMASKWKVSESSMQDWYFGFKREKEIIENIEHWKRYASFFLNHPKKGIRYEDLLLSESKRNDFLVNNFEKNEKFKIENFSGTKSSFNDNRFNQRYKQVNFSDMFKDIANSDSDLHYLIKEFDYNDIDKIL